VADSKDPKAFAHVGREPAPKRPARLRVHDWREFTLARSEPQITAQAGRCMDCGVPFCQQGCPLGNQIPDFNELVRRGRWREAWRALESTNNLPEMTGRLCPAPCEAACVLAIAGPDGKSGEAVTIEQLEREIVERAFAEGWVQPRPAAAATGRRVAIVGSGPAGLAAAQQLARAGHHVEVFERDEALGGLLRFGIPDFKLEKSVIDRRLALLRAEGVRFHTGVHVGAAPTWSELRARFDAVVVAVGAMQPRELDVPGRELTGVHQAMAFLAAQNRAVAGAGAGAAVEGEPPRSAIDVAGKRVVILGGGDTGSDCLGTALRQGASWVGQYEILPAPPGPRLAANPWPQWPHVFRTSSSQEEGGERQWSLRTTALEGEGGRLQRLRAVRVERAEGPEGPRWIDHPEDALTVDVDVLVLALGFRGPDLGDAQRQLGLELDARGLARTDARFRSSVPGVWVVGDAARGASLIVWAIADGREAARDVDAQLRGAAPRLPTKGLDQAFDARS